MKEESESLIKKPEPLRRLLNGCIVAVGQDKYKVHFLNISRKYEFTLFDDMKNKYELHNTLKDKIKTPEEVDELLKYNVIQVISIPSAVANIFNPK